MGIVAILSVAFFARVQADRVARMPEVVSSHSALGDAGFLLARKRVCRRQQPRLAFVNEGWRVCQEPRSLFGGAS